MADIQQKLGEAMDWAGDALKGLSEKVGKGWEMLGVKMEGLVNWMNAKTENSTIFGAVLGFFGLVEKLGDKEKKEPKVDPEVHREARAKLAEQVSVRPRAQEQYKPEDLQRIERSNADRPPELKPEERYVSVSKNGREALDYYRGICGENPEAWLLNGNVTINGKPLVSNGRLRVFGTEVFKPNIILACLLLEMEHRCRQLGMGDLKFKYITTTAHKPGAHGLGLAADFDPNENELDSVHGGTWNLPVAFARLGQQMGLKWGMYFNREDGDVDPMHMEIRTSLPEVMGLLTSPDATKLAQPFKVPGAETDLLAYARDVDQRLYRRT